MKTTCFRYDGRSQWEQSSSPQSLIWDLVHSSCHYSQKCQDRGSLNSSPKLWEGVHEGKYGAGVHGDREPRLGVCGLCDRQQLGAVVGLWQQMKQPQDGGFCQ